MTRSTTLTTSTLASIAPVRDRCLPVDDVLAPMLPDAGLQRGRIIGCSGPAAMSLALALASRAVVTGSWLAVVGMPMLGAEAAAELGVPLSRVVQVTVDGGPGVWAERVAAAADGFDVIMTRPPPGAERMVRKVRQRLQARGVVLLSVGPTSPGVSCDLELVTSDVSWAGLGQGWGHLAGRRTTVRAGGRRIPRPIVRELWVPGPTGRIEPVRPALPGADVVSSPAGRGLAPVDLRDDVPADVPASRVDEERGDLPALSRAG